MERLVREARRLMPEVGIQIPPNLADWWPRLVAAGATDLGGLSANGDHISPEHPFPSPHQVRKRLAQDGYALTERLCVYPQFIDPEWIAQGVLDVIKTRYWSFIPRRGSGRIDGPKGALRADTVARARAGEALDADELTALFAETRPEAIEDMRQAADDLRAELAGDTVTFVVNRNINVSNVCVVGCAFCGFGQGRRSPDAYQHDEAELRARVRDAVAYGATEICMQSGIHPEWAFDDYLRWLRIVKDEAPDLHLHAYSPMEIDAMAGDQPLTDVFARLIEAGLGSVPGTAAEVLHDGVRQRISPNKLPAARWVEVIEAAHAAGLRSTVTVMFGHIEEPHELAEHMRVVRGPAGAHGRVHRVRPAVLHPLPHAAGPHARHRGDLARREPQAHGGVPARARQERAQPPGELGEDGARRRHGGAALGRQRPRRNADGGEHLAARGLLPRREARPGGPRGRRPPRRAPRGGAHDALRGAPPLPARRRRGVSGALALGRALAAGELDAEAVCDAALAAARAAPATFLAVTEERARAEAAGSAARLRAGAPAGPLDGVPVAWKDLLDVAGTPTTAASALRRDAPPADADAPVVARLAAAGMVCVGKTNLSELAFSGLGTNPHFGTPENPRAPGRVPGGSSSGSAAAVAAGIVPVAIGTDTAGSIRVPAAFCGVAGFKPSAARIDRTGLMALAPSLDSIGPLALEVADLIAVDAALRGAAGVAAGDRGNGGPLRLVVPAGELTEDVEPAIAERFAADLDALAAAGARIVRRPLAALDRARALLAEHGGMVAHEAWRGHVALLDSPDAARLDPPVLRRLREGRALPAAGYDALLAARPGVQAELADELGGALVALPAVALAPPEIAPLLADVERFLAVNALALRATLPLSFLDAPGVTLPSGLLVTGPSGTDDRVLAAAARAEAALA